MPIKTPITSISSFTGPYRFLSNFYPCNIIFDNLTFPSVEHAYQASKAINKSDKIQILNAETPGEAKKLGSKIQVRDDWEEVKLYIMDRLVTQKFYREPFRSKLLSTKPLELIEGNTWGDTFWGICNDKGENHLGKLLMRIRDMDLLLRDEESN